MPNTPDGRKSVNFRHSRQGSLGYVRPAVAIEEMGSVSSSAPSLYPLNPGSLGYCRIGQRSARADQRSSPYQDKQLL